MNTTASEDVLILAIESSCDETAAAVVKNGREVLSNVISSQIDLHTLYGGVVPEIASRRHAEAISRALESLRAAREAMLLGVTPDAVLTEAEEAMAAIGELTGASIREDITNRIFARFCVGK